MTIQEVITKLTHAALRSPFGFDTTVVHVQEEWEDAAVFAVELITDTTGGAVVEIRREASDHE